MGHYCPEATAVEIPCPPGKYCSQPQLTTDEGDCDAGHYCISGATTNTPTDEATEGGDECPPGNYCPAGSSSPIPCDPGYYRTAPGGTIIDDCDICPGGKYCDTFGASSVAGDCDEGFYCAEGSTVSNPAICPEGNYCPTGSEDPVPCDAGDYQDIKGQGTCKSCPAGYECTASTRSLCRPDEENESFYCPDGQRDRVKCNAGEFTQVIGAETAADC